MANESGSMFSKVRQYASRWKTATPAAINVLIVDDEEPICRFVERVLRDAGYKTFVAGSGADAVEMASKLESLDVLVTDVMMPKMMGDEVARRLRQERPAIKVLYLTGYSDSLFKEKVMLWEDEAFLDKPCTIKSLLQALSMLLFGSLDTPAQLKAGAAEN